MIEVVRPGPATTVQVLPWGRGTLGRAHLGVSAGGPADPLAAAVANRLVDNPARAAVLEMTLGGTRLRFPADATIALCGAPCPLRVDDEVRPAGERVSIRAGQLVDVGRCAIGLRAFLAVRGGIDPAVAGRLLQRGDVVDGASLPPLPLENDLPPLPPLDGVLRATPGPEAALFPPEAHALLHARAWRVLPTSDRRGIRLVADDGSGGVRLAVPHVEMVTQGVTAGAIQVPPSGEPLVLFVDQQTTGGYPRIAHVISVDVGKLGQLRPGDLARFQIVDFDEATALFRAWHKALALSST